MNDWKKENVHIPVQNCGLKYHSLHLIVLPKYMTYFPNIIPPHTYISQPS